MKKITLKAARVNAGLTQEEAAQAINVTGRTLISWENGVTYPTVGKPKNSLKRGTLTCQNTSFFRQGSRSAFKQKKILFN